MNAWWTNLSERDRWAAIAGVSFLLCYLFYLLIFSPLLSAVKTNRSQLQENRETLAWMKQVQQELGNHKNTQSITRNKLLTVVSAQLGKEAFRPFSYQLQQTAQGDILLTFDSVPYNVFISWLWTLSQDYAITLDQFAIERSKTPGVVKVSVIISTR
ncbi:type II secretion system protein GspM [Legionella sp. CNM-4043-24]|uniref:type II secretion system protein GspM n=1 Tax=Legionella sp. CNM-4043-24 TaxID=3421646 RepID=UPI00403AC54B